MSEPNFKFSAEFNQNAIKEIQNMMKDFEEHQSMRADEYISLHQRIKAKIAKVQKEKAEMENMLKDFEQKLKNGGRPVLIKGLKFYLDSLDAFEFKKMIVGLEEEITALKREMEETHKNKVDMINNFKEFMGTPGKHLILMKEEAEKQRKFEKLL